MKLTILLASAISSASAFAPSNSNAFVRTSATVVHGKMDGMDLSGNNWTPDSAKMGSTDTGDYFPEGYNPDEGPDFSEGMMGSQMGGNKRSGPELPGMENLGDDAVMMGGIEDATDIPAGMAFVASSVPDGAFGFQVASSSKGGELVVEIKPFCMGFEDFYASFTSDSHPTLKVSPCAGRMDRRGGEITYLTISCAPGGKAGDFVGDLVINLPEDNSKLSYKVTVNSF